MSRHPETRELHYEGFPLEAVLGRVYTEQGADAAIVSADRVRKGGIAGFFTKELFRVTVAVDALLDRGPDAAPADGPGAGATPRNAAGPGSPPPGFQTLGVIDFDDIDPEDIDGALDLDTPDDAAIERTEEEKAIWAMLAETTRPDAPRATTPPDPSTPAEEHSEPAPAPAPAKLPAAFTPPSLPVEIVAPILTSGPIASTQIIARTFSPVSPLIAPSARTGDGRVAGRVVATGGVSPPGRVVTLRSRRVRRSFGANLDLDGLIAEFATTSGETVRPPQVGVVAVVGVHFEAVEVAASLARQLGIDPDDVVIAAPHATIEIPTELDATRLAATARYRCNPVAIVVVELVPGRLGHEWVRAVLQGLRAEQVRLAVSADRLIAQQRLTIAALGGVDAIDLTDATLCPGPEEALDLGVPIATIDGRPATPEMWAATVLACDHREQSTVARNLAGTR